MTKNLEQKMRAELNDLLNDNEELEYVLYGQVAPDLKRIVSILGVWVILVLLIIMSVLPIGYYLIGVVLLLAILSYTFFYKTAYFGKLGKSAYVFITGKLNFNSKKEKMLLKSIVIDPKRSSDFHLTIFLNVKDKNEYIIFKRSSENRGLSNQATNMKKLVLDINKKRKR